MRSGLPAISLVGGGAAFGATGLSLALTGLGVPLLAGCGIAGLCAGLLIYFTGRWVMERAGEPGKVAPGADPEHRVRQLEESGARLRHDLRGVLSPALMMADRLLRSDDPGIRRAGEAVVRSVEKATALLAESKRQSGVEEPAGAPDAAAPPRPPQAAGTGVQSR